MLAILILTLPVGLYAPQAFKLFPLSMIAGFGPPLVYLSAKAAHSPSLGERLKLLPLLTITGFGLCLNTSVAVIEGLVGKGGVFVRTPKLNLQDFPKKGKAVDKAYIAPVSPLVWLEIILGLYAMLTATVLEPYRLGHRTLDDYLHTWIFLCGWAEPHSKTGKQQQEAPQPGTGKVHLAGSC